MKRDLEREDDQIALDSMLDYFQVQSTCDICVNDLMVFLYDIVNHHNYNNLHWYSSL